MSLSPLLLAALLAASPAGARAPGPSETGSGLVSIDLKDADLEEVLRLLARAGHVNLVVDPLSARDRKVTVLLHDVPWQQALDLVVRPHGLVAVAEGGVVRVAPSAKLVQEQQQQRMLAEEIELSGSSARIVGGGPPPRLVMPGSARAPLAEPALTGVHLRIEVRAVETRTLPPAVTSDPAHSLPVRSAEGRAAVSAGRLVVATELDVALDDETVLEVPALPGEPEPARPRAVVVSSRRDGQRLVVTVREAARGGDSWWADAREEQVLALPGSGPERAVLVLSPA